MLMTHLQAIVTPLQGRLVGADCEFRGVSTDTRAIQPGQLFVALSGERFDGHEFVAQALAAGAVAVLVERPLDIDVPQLVVGDSLLALGQLAAWRRQQFSLPLVAITGSAGKTTVKEMTAAILQQQASVLATAGNFNNEIGMPLTLLQLAPEHQYAVLEMGAAKAGDIDYLAGFAKPDVALVNNAMEAHLEGFGSLAGVARTKGEMYDHLRPDGVAVVNLDDPHAPQWLQRSSQARQLTFSRQRQDADVWADDISFDRAGCGRFALQTPSGSAAVHLQVMGAHNIGNALAAAAIAEALSIPVEMIAAGLASYGGFSGRLQPRAGVNGSLIIDDSYNANPGAVRSAIDILANCSQPNRLLVLGDMGELGDQRIELHRQVGEYALAAGLDGLYSVGELSEQASAVFAAAGRHFDEQKTLITALRERLNDTTVVLVKGSRSAHLEHVVEALLAAQPEALKSNHLEEVK